MACCTASASLIVGLTMVIVTSGACAPTPSVAQPAPGPSTPPKAAAPQAEPKPETTQPHDAPSPSSNAAPSSCLEWLKTGAQSAGNQGRLVICDPGDDDAVRALANHAAGPDVPVIDRHCRLERICGTLAGVDCDSAVDGPYDYYDIRSWRVVAQCGGHCMGGGCTNCPPKEMTCPTY